MFLDKKTKNKYTIGKLLRKEKQLYCTDSNATEIKPSKKFQQYYQVFKKKGIKINGVKVAEFQTKNGLRYFGLIATQRLDPEAIIIKVPLTCVLTTRVAFYSKIQQIFVQNPQHFSPNFTKKWQDRIILVFLLYEAQKGKSSEWYHLINNLPTDTDFLIFWSKADLDFLEDPLLTENISKERQEYEEEMSKLERILSHYPDLLKPQSFSPEKIRWLYSQIITRCFGEYFEFYSMVPFAELFNHQNTGVHYKLSSEQKVQQSRDKKDKEEYQFDQCQSSNQSNQGKDFIENDYIDLSLGQNKEDSEAQTISSLVNNPKKRNLNVEVEIDSLKRQIYNIINLSDGISLSYVSEAFRQFQRCRLIEDYKQRIQSLKEIEAYTSQYSIKKKNLDQKLKRKQIIPYQQKVNNMTQSLGFKGKKAPPKNSDLFPKGWPADKHDNFYMCCSQNDQFQKGSQVYFCYNRLSNYMMLSYYGMSIQHNKYDDVFIRVNLQERINANHYLKDLLDEVKVKKYKSFKLKRTKFCVDLIIYFKSLNWKWDYSIQKYFSITSSQTEIKALQNTKEILLNRLLEFKDPLQSNEKELYNPRLSHHQYFGLIYKIESQRILNQHISMIDYAIDIIQKISQGYKLKQLLAKETQHIKLSYQLIMEPYFQMIDFYEFGKKKQ